MFHDLRHSTVRFLVNEGNVGLDLAQRHVGHSSPWMTQRYAHLAKRTRDDLANRTQNTKLTQNVILGLSTDNPPQAKLK